MTRVDWASHPAVRKIDIRKLSVLMALINQSEGKSFSEMIPSIIEANKHLTAMALKGRCSSKDFEIVRSTRK